MHFTLKSKGNEKNPEVWMLASMKINKIPRENKLKVLQIVWADMKMCVWNY